MGLAGVSLGRELKALALSHTASVRRGTAPPPENSVTNSCADCALTQQMVGSIKAISPCVKSPSAKLFLDLHTVSAPSGEERTLGLGRWGQPHRSSALDGAAAVLTAARTRGVAVRLSLSWSHQPQGRACAAAPALRDTFDLNMQIILLYCVGGAATLHAPKRRTRFQSAKEARAVKAKAVRRPKIQTCTHTSPLHTRAGRVVSCTPRPSCQVSAGAGPATSDTWRQRVIKLRLCRKSRPSRGVAAHRSPVLSRVGWVTIAPRASSACAWTVSLLELM